MGMSFNYSSVVRTEKGLSVKNKLLIKFPFKVFDAQKVFVAVEVA